MNKIVFIVPVLSFVMVFSFPYVYKTFCQLTGYEGKSIQTSENIEYTLSDSKCDYSIFFKLNSSVEKENNSLVFSVSENQVNFCLDQAYSVDFFIQNNTDEDKVLQVIYNTQPDQMSLYLVKIKCFCFESFIIPQQTEMTFPFIFYVQSDIQKNSSIGHMKDFSLYYHIVKH